MTVYLFIYPILAVVSYFTFIILLNKKMSRKIQYVDIGLIFGSVVLVYLLFPAIGMLLDAFDYGVIADSRLVQGFTLDEVSEVQSVYLAFYISFLTGYLYFRRYQPVNVANNNDLHKQEVVYIIFGAMLTYLISQAIGFVYGANVTDYISSYTALSSAPLLVQQIQNVLTQAHLSFSICFVVYACHSFPFYRKYILIWIFTLIAYATLTGGSRSYAFILLLSYVISISFFSKFNFLILFKSALIILVLFSAAGLFRNTDVDLNMLNIFLTGEFTSLFINALDLNRYPSDFFDTEFRFTLYFADFIRIIPAQLIGIEKLDPAKWYAETFYSEYQYAGGGFGFGLISESVIGFGLYEGIARGFVLSLLFAKISNKILHRNTSLFSVFIYVWLSVSCYLAFRDTTFSLGVRSLYQILPALMLLKVASVFGRRGQSL